jgi:hypothetical protein
MNTFDRRTFFIRAGATGLLAALGAPGIASENNAFHMWHSPGCGCCLQWGRRMETAFGRALPVREMRDMPAVKRANGVPEDLWSCHTAMVGKVVVEGHVPPADIKRLIETRNSPYTGLAVAGMPAGAPGMDIGHDHKEPYQVIAFGRGGKRAVFASYGS